MAASSTQSEITLLTNQIEQLTISQQKPRPPKKTLYWGIKLSIDQIVSSYDPIKDALTSNPDLKQNKEMHTTLLFVGRKDNPDEEQYKEHIGKKCTVTIGGHGISSVALCLHVIGMVFTETNTPVPSCQQVKQHVTVALKEGTKAVDSVKALDEGTYVEYTQPLQLDGVLYQYFF